MVRAEGAANWRRNLDGPNSWRLPHRLSPSRQAHARSVRPRSDPPLFRQSLFANSDLFRWREAFEARIPLDGETTLIVSDGADHRRRRRLVQPALHHRQAENYLAVMAESADAAIEQWQPGQRIDIHQASISPILRATVQSLLGRRIAEEAPFFEEQLRDLTEVLDQVPTITTWKRRLSTPQWRRAMAARHKLDQWLYPEIDQARRRGADEDDHILTSLVHCADEPAEALTDTEVRDQIVSLMMASYGTTPALIAWTIYGMLSTPGVWERPAVEVAVTLGGRWLEAADLKRLTYLNGVVLEALRLYPAGVSTARYVAREFQFAGRRIKQGSIVVFSDGSHRDPRAATLQAVAVPSRPTDLANEQRGDATSAWPTSRRVGLVIAQQAFPTQHWKGLFQIARRKVLITDVGRSSSAGRRAATPSRLLVLRDAQA